eukprot:SAG11_NODE_10117_length_853_cov_9.026525_1_plen_70_part_01
MTDPLSWVVPICIISPGRSHGEQQQREHEQCHEQSLYTFLVLDFTLSSLLYLILRVFHKNPTCFWVDFYA